MRRRNLTETWLVLGVSLGASAVWSLLRIVDKLTLAESLGSQTTAMNSSVTPDRPWLDLAYQLTGIVIALVPVLLALHLLRRDDPNEPHTMGFDLRRPWQDLWRGALLAAAIGLPGLALYAAAKALDLNTTIAAANLAGAWWTIPVLVARGGPERRARGGRHGRLPLQPLGLGRLGEVADHPDQRADPRQLPPLPGLRRVRRELRDGHRLRLVLHAHKRVMPLVVAHTILDVVAFVGYALLKSRLGWL